MNVTIIGAGASGIACAIRTKQFNSKIDVTILEHLDTPAKKILATGNGRCNISNLSSEGYYITEEFLRRIGLVMKEDGEGRMYPYSNQATSVRNILLDACSKYGIKIETSCSVNDVKYENNTFKIATSKGLYSSDILVLATGGKAQSALGSDGSGYDIARSLGHHITHLNPGLVQLISPNKNCRKLSGIRTKCSMRIESEGVILTEEYGELLFTDYGLSGIVSMDASLSIDENEIAEGVRYSALVDFVPEMDEDAIVEHIREFGSLEGILPKILCEILEKQSNGDITKIGKLAKNQKFIITGTKGYDFAQITQGGVYMSELDEWFESTIVPGLYIVGELTDNQFRCGGFNLDFAIVSGIKAAHGIAKDYD